LKTINIKVIRPCMTLALALAGAAHHYSHLLKGQTRHS
jgi:hypothetical protein